MDVETRGHRYDCLISSPFRFESTLDESIGDSTISCQFIDVKASPWIYFCTNLERYTALEGYMLHVPDQVSRHLEAI
jgi:hypothetical protein